MFSKMSSYSCNNKHSNVILRSYEMYLETQMESHITKTIDLRYILALKVWLR
jgi:hypothetical protein